MRESLRLQDKSILIHGDFNSLTQALIREFTTQGADVGFINAEKPGVGRFLENINDTREVHQQAGRAAQIDVTLKCQGTAKEAVGRMAEHFGRIDVMIDVRLNTVHSNETSPQSSQYLLSEVAPFFKSKKRGRVVFVREDESLARIIEQKDASFSEDFMNWTQKLSEEWPSPNFGVNTVTVGLTEDILLKKFPQSKSIRSSLENLQKNHPHAQLIDANDVTSVVLFLSSAGSCGLSGQRLRVIRQAS